MTVLAAAEKNPRNAAERLAANALRHAVTILQARMNPCGACLVVLIDALHPR